MAGMVLLAGCSSPKVAISENARGMSVDDRQRYYDEQLALGQITSQEHKEWSAGNARIRSKDLAEKEALAAMTPYERKQIELKERELALQADSLLVQRVQAKAISDAALQSAINTANVNNATRAAAMSPAVAP